MEDAAGTQLVQATDQQLVQAADPQQQIDLLMEVGD